MKKKISITIDESLLEEVESEVDGLRIQNRSQAIENLLEKSLGKNKTAVVLCGGSPEENRVDGKLRFCAEVDDSTLIEENVKKLRREGFSKIYVVGQEETLTEIFSLVKNGGRYGLDIEYVEEGVSQGTFQSLKLLRGKVDSTFLVLYGDVFTRANLENLWDRHLENRGQATLMLITSSEPERSGVVGLEGEKIDRFTQKPGEAEDYIIFSSVLVCEPGLLEYEGKSLEEDVFPKLIEDGVLYGHLTSKDRIHVHEEDDFKELKNFI
ncbi:MAG: NDP-sugar synthase [Candidatus Aenigmatarchaeota archaeon]